MKNIKFKINILKKINKFNNYLINQFNKIGKIKIKHSKFNKISNFSKILITSISLLFFYLFYLSIPSLYNKGNLQKDISDKLLKEFNINFSISSEINYSILPAPHFLVKNAKIFKDDLNNPKELVQIKKLKIFISQKNFFKQYNLDIKKILIEDANFFIKKNDFDFFNKYLNKKFSKKKILVKDVKFFFKDKNDETISIFSVYDLNLFFNEKKKINQLVSEGRAYQFPFTLKWTRNFSGEINRTTLLELKKLNLKIKNISFVGSEKYSAESQISVIGKKLFFDYMIENNLISFFSTNLELVSQEAEYAGTIKLNPFNFKIDINLNELDLRKITTLQHIIEELLKTNLFFNKNLNGYIKLSSKKVLGNKLFDGLRILINFDSGNINLDNSYLTSEKLGSLILYKSSMETINNELLFRGSYDFKITKQNMFYRFFQIPKKNRKIVKNVFFDLEYNMFTNEIKILDLKINDLDKGTNDYIIEFLDEYNDKSKQEKIKNWIDLKNFVNKIVINYFG